MNSVALMNLFPITVLGIESVLDGMNVDVLFSTSITSDLLEFLDKNTVSSVICDIPYSVIHQRGLLFDFFHKINEASDNVVIMTSCSDKLVITDIVSEFDFSIISSQEEFSVVNMQLDKALRGEETLSPKILSILNTSEFNEASYLDCLTGSERKVLFYLLSGNSVSEIARYFTRSIKTISAHKINIMKKLGVDNETQLFSKVTRL